MSKTPPKYPLFFFRWFCHPDYVEDIEGDLLERFEKRPSKWRFTWEVMKLFRPSLMKPASSRKNLNYYDMFKHNLLITFRSFVKYKSSFLINLIGLSTGLACTLLIYLWVNDELHVDKFHRQDSQLFNVMGNHHKAEGINTWNGMPAPLAKALEEEFPEIEKAAAATDPAWNMNFSLSVNEKKLTSVGKYVSESYFDLFSYEIIQGSMKEHLRDRNSIMISDRVAKKLFKDEKDIIGKTIKWESASDNGLSTITGVFKSPPSNSTDQFDFLLPFEIYLEEQQNWYAPISVTYVLLEKEADLEVVNSKIKEFLKSKVEASNTTLFLKKYSDNYLYSNHENGVEAGGRIQYVRLFSIIALIILLIACINFMNLSTAKASRRIKELGVKKASGATRGNLIIQYLGESVLISFISLACAVFLVYMLLPAFNQLTDKEINLNFDQNIILTSLAITFFVGLISGSYPALYLSGFNPIDILKGTLKSSAAEVWIRKGLVIFQFSISIVLIVSVFVVYKQVAYVQNKNLGYSKENLILFESNGKISENFDTFMTELKNIPGIENASGMTNGMFGAPGGELTWNGTSNSNFSRFIVYYDFIETLGLSIEQGESFSREYTGDGKIVINKSAADLMGLEDPVGTKVKFWGNDARIVGVVNDFHFSSLHEEIGPLFMHLFPPKYLTSIIVKLNSNNHSEALERLDEFYSRFNPGYELDYRFLDTDYQQLYESENKVGLLSKYFAAIAIIISCLGLFGLAAFTTERRTKEIGIRKILGSNVFQIVYLLTKDFTKLVLIAIAIALPIGYFIIENWLNSFAFRIDITWPFFVWSALLAIAMAWVSIGWQTIKASFINPSKCLRNE